MFKQIMIASVSSMIVYALISEGVKFFNWFGDNNLEAALIRIVIPLVIAIFVMFIVFGLIIKVKRPY